MVAVGTHTIEPPPINHDARRQAGVNKAVVLRGLKRFAKYQGRINPHLAASVLHYLDAMNLPSALAQTLIFKSYADLPLAIRQRRDLKIAPPRDLVAKATQIPMVVAAQGHCEIRQPRQNDVNAT